VFLGGATAIKAGDIVQARVTGADEYDLWAEQIPSPRSSRPRA